MQHEFKIIYTFDPDGYILSDKVKVFIDNEQVGAIQEIKLNMTSDMIYPEIDINFNIDRIVRDLPKSSDLFRNYMKLHTKFSKMRRIKSDLYYSLQKYINLKAFL